MKSYRRPLVACVAVALMLLLQFSCRHGRAARNGGPDKDKDKKDDRRPVEFTYTKWITTAPLPAPLPWRMKGFVNGGVRLGSFVGELLDRKVTTNGKITKLKAISTRSSTASAGSPRSWTADRTTCSARRGSTASFSPDGGPAPASMLSTRS